MPTTPQHASFQINLATLYLMKGMEMKRVDEMEQQIKYPSISWIHENKLKHTQV